MPGSWRRCEDLGDDPLAECILLLNALHALVLIFAVTAVKFLKSESGGAAQPFSICLQPDHVISPDWGPSIYISVCHQFFEVLAHNQLQKRLDCLHNC